MDEYILSTERLGLRRWKEPDTQPFIEMNKDAAVMKYFPSLLTDDETIAMIERINLHVEQKGFGLFAVENKSTGEFLGFTGFSTPAFECFFTPCVEIGWRYKKKAWGKGFATEAASACLQYGFNVLGFGKVFSFTPVINKKSESVMQRIGMKYLATFNHPNIPADNILCPHLLYQLDKI